MFFVVEGKMRKKGEGNLAVALESKTKKGSTTA
jgi:hypothetical protein